MQRLEAALGAALARDAPGPHRLGEALERLWPEIGHSNRPPSSRRVRSAITTVPGLGERLQAGGQVRRLADDRLLLRRALADQVADHDQAGGDADARRRARPAGVAGRRRRRQRASPARTARSASSSCALRPAEVGQHAVAHELGDVPVEARDHLGCQRSW